MAEKFVNTRVLQKTDSANNWKTNNPVLKAGEIGYESDTHKIKIGDGKTAWTNLEDISYFPEEGGTLKGKIEAQSYLSGTWLRSTQLINNNYNNNYKGIAVLDDQGWIYKRTLDSFLGDINSKLAIDNKLDSTSNIRESKLIQDTYSTAGFVNEYDRLLIHENKANRVAYMDPQYVQLEYSTDGGSTWQTYANKDNVARNLFGMTGNTSLYIGGSEKVPNKEITPDNFNQFLTRVTLISPATRYCQANKFYCVRSGPHSTYVRLEISTNAKPDTFEVWCDNTIITGWSGPNMITLPRKDIFGTRNEQVHSIRWIFGYSAASTKYPNYLANVGDFRIFGITAWSALAQNDLPYNTDASCNIFPRTHFIPDLGKIDFPWNNIYGTTLFENGKALNKKYIATTGGTFTGPINFKDAAALPQKNLEYICGIDGFSTATSGQLGWQTKSQFLAGYATQYWVEHTAKVADSNLLDTHPVSYFATVDNLNLKQDKVNGSENITINADGKTIEWKAPIDGVYYEEIIK